MLLLDPEGATRTGAKGRKFFTFLWLSEGSSAILPAPCRGSEGRDLLLEGSPKSVCARFLNRSDRHSRFASEGQWMPFLTGVGFCETTGALNFLFVSATESGNLVWTLMTDSAALNLWVAFCCSLQISFAGDIFEISGFFGPIPGGVLSSLKKRHNSNVYKVKSFTRTYKKNINFMWQEFWCVHGKDVNLKPLMMKSKVGFILDTWCWRGLGRRYKQHCSPTRMRTLCTSRLLKLSPLHGTHHSQNISNQVKL